jgi:hypothetical protein
MDFPDEDIAAVGEVETRAADAVACLAAEGAEAAASRFNARPD